MNRLKAGCRVSIFFSIAVLLFTQNAFAQQTEASTQLVRVETHSGNIYIGHLISENEESIVVLTDAIGEVTINRIHIKKITYLDPDQLKNGEYWFKNPHSSRYFFSPTAYGLNKGEGYYQNVWILFHNVNYGVTDNFSIGLGVIPLFLMGAASPVWITPKVTIPVTSDKFNLAAGALVGSVPGTDNFEVFGIFYGVGTYGNRDRNISVGLGYGFLDGEVSSSPVVNFGFITRTSRRFYIVSENYFFPTTGVDGLISIGVRWASENAAVDFSLMRSLDNSFDYIGFPLLGVTIPFGRK